MAGAKGRSGGARPGAGRKAKDRKEQDQSATSNVADGPEVPAVVETREPLEFLLDVMQGKVDPTARQLRAAVAAAQYFHMKKGDGGKKDDADAKAKTAASGRFRPGAPPPKLVSSK